ncbi:MAG: TetR/AcrR family transcriptional regulator [Myxococcota bacterium]
MTRSRWISDLHWVRTGQQPRAQATQEAILEAAAWLIAEKGVEAASVADVAARADCSVGSVYHHFRDKRTLLYAVIDRMSEQLSETIRDAVDPTRWAGAKVVDILRAYLEFSLETSRPRPIFQEAGVVAARSDARVREHLAALRGMLDDGLAALLLARRDEIGHPDPELATRFVLDQLGALLHVRLNPLPIPTALDGRPDAVFIAEAIRASSDYLRLEGR